MKITPQEILDWRQNPTTAKIMALLKKRREDLKERIISEAHVIEDLRRIQGICEGYQDLLDMTYEYFVQEYNLQEEEDVNSDAEYADGTR